MTLDRCASPAELGLSRDARRLGVLLRALELTAPQRATQTPRAFAQNPSIAAE